MAGRFAAYEAERCGLGPSLMTSAANTANKFVHDTLQVMQQALADDIALIKASKVASKDLARKKLLQTAKHVEAREHAIALEAVAAAKEAERRCVVRSMARQAKEAKKKEQALANAKHESERKTEKVRFSWQRQSIDWSKKGGCSIGGRMRRWLSHRMTYEAMAIV